MVNSELDWLEIRLNEMNTEVDYFVILEAPTTFTGLAKNMTFQENRAKFSAFEDKIIYHVLTDAPPQSPTPRYPAPKNTKRMHGSKRSSNETPCSPSPTQLQFPLDPYTALTILLLFLSISTPRRTVGASPSDIYQGLENTIKPHSLRSRHGGHVHVDERDSKVVGNLWNAAWHCSSCFSTLKEMRRKMESFSHTNLNKQEFRMTDRIVDRVGKGKDLWDRFGQLYQGPPIKFGYMVDRDGEGAGFVDYEEIIEKEKKGMDLI
ncbi:glycosyltransferase family 17 [Botrytis cinerea]